MSLIALLRHAVKDKEENLEHLYGVSIISDHFERSGKSVEIKKVAIDGSYDVSWVLNDQSSRCMCCANSFGITQWRHHCRTCGCLVCHGCTKNRTIIPELNEVKGSRTCKTCTVDDGFLPRPSNDVLKTRIPFLSTTAKRESSTHIPVAIEILDKGEIDEIFLKTALEGQEGSDGATDPATTTPESMNSDSTNYSEVISDVDLHGDFSQE